MLCSWCLRGRDRQFERQGYTEQPLSVPRPLLWRLRDCINLLVYDTSEITDELFQERYEAATIPEIVADPPLKWRGRPPLEDLWCEPIDKLSHEVLLIHGREDRVLPMDSFFASLKGA